MKFLFFYALFVFFAKKNKQKRILFKNSNKKMINNKLDTARKNQE